ncbi:MAG: hypothetical protein IT167_10015 [Bryobacterales bacterium]|nr:hypothetical protein [Bryobacterales bacterium]
MELGWGGRETFVPQSYSLGQEGQVDWKEAYLDFEEEPRKVQAFRMRSMASGGAFHRAYPHATQQAFPEAHESAFSYFGGVFGNLRHDNTEECREEDLSRLPARGDGTIHWLPFALGIHSGVLHSGAGTGERRSGGRERILPPERMPLGKAIPDVARRVGRSVRGVQAEGWRTLMVDATGVGVPVVDLPRRGGLG